MPFEPEFWNKHEQRLLEIMLPFFESGAQDAIAAIGPGIEETGLRIDWGAIHGGVMDWAREHVGELIGQITETERQNVARAVENWIASGEPLDKLVDRLTPTFGPNRARLIAGNEITNIFTEINVRTWMDSGAATKEPKKRPPQDSHIGCRCWLAIERQGDGSWLYRWRTAKDELVCPVCRPLDGSDCGQARQAPS